MKYIRDTLHYGLIYIKSQPEFVGYTNIDWGVAINWQQSTSGWLFMMESVPISWSSKCQASISQSSYESKNYTLSETGKEGVGFHDLRKEEDLLGSPNTLQNNNTTDQFRSSCQSCIKSGILKCTKYIDTKFHWIWDVIKQGIFLLKFLSTQFIVINGLMKPLLLKQF